MVIIPGNKKNLARRFYANLIDYTILFFLFIILGYLFGEPNEKGGFHLGGARALLMPVLWILYFPVCESVMSQTLGKKAFDLYVVTLNGETPTIVEALLRRMFDMLEWMTFGVGALLTINYSERNQRLGDKIAGTTVVRTRAVCRFCGTALELTPKEVIRNAFICPACTQVN